MAANVSLNPDASVISVNLLLPPMDASRFKALVDDTRRTRQELEQMMRNALAKGERELAHIAKEALDKRFADWAKPRHRASGARSTVVRYRGSEQHFPTAKEAYVWLIQHFVDAKPALFQIVNWETAFVARGKKRNYFGRNRRRMFHGSPHLADDSNNYARLPNGWYMNTNLSNREKFDILCRFAAIARLRHGTDWTWEVVDPTAELKEKLDQQLLADRIFFDFEDEPSHGNGPET